MVQGGGRQANSNGFWGPVLNAVVNHQPTATMWEAIRAEADRYGLTFSSNVLQEVNQLRANAAAIVSASERLTGSSTPTVITSDVMARPWYGRSLAEQAASPAYDVWFQIDTMTAQGPSTGWYHLQYGTDLPDTVARLREDVNMFAADFAGAYGHELMGVSQLRIDQV